MLKLELYQYHCNYYSWLSCILQ